ncbi:L-asparaginase 1 [Desulfomicrobium orale DSM 12838]|uniref:asparaginase n=1 Tax=Desulfomicrobium orale DSM 12838 TaxID=888061 RepID=A0A120KMV2_9BACT|nr:L-asparaginase 1 [Desulfomicrobium orale DSM 12838]
MEDAVKKRVAILYTGGTIGMKPTPDGYAPEPGHLSRLMASMPDFSAPEVPAYIIREYEPLLDSSNMGPRHWQIIARDIAKLYTGFDGFIVIHGTDTMAYTASALPFMLEGLDKPVILTGSQIPLCEIRSDGRDNLITALMIIAQAPVPEVCLCFGNRLLRGCRATKVDAAGFQAFDSPNYPDLGTIGVTIRTRRPCVPPETARKLTIHALSEARVGALRLFPGISAELVANVLRSPLQGLVLETYGMGNGPSDDRELMAVLAEACGRGVVIVNCTQCLRGAVNQSGYQAGSALAACGVASGADMTPEAALTKMIYLFSLGLPPEEIRMQMTRNLRGELTEDESLECAPHL